MKKPVKLQDVQTATFWNDTHKLTLIFQPIDDVTEPPIDPPVEPLAIPTGIKLTEYNIVEPPVEPPVEINIPTGIKLSTYNN